MVRCWWDFWRLYLGDKSSSPSLSLRLHVVWLWLFKWTSRLQTGHKRLRFIQSLIIEIPCKWPLSALNMWFLLMSVVNCRMATAARLHLFVGSQVGGGQHLFYTSFRRCHATEAENHHANPVIWPWVRGSGSRLSTNPPFMDICFNSCATGQILPSSAARPWLIFYVSERWVAVLPHCNKQMAARS